MKDDNSSLHIHSLCSREIRDESTIIRSHQLPIYPTSSFRFDTIEQGMDVFLGKKKEHLYARYGNPTVDAVADKIAQLESYETGIEAKAYLTSSGMSAISTVLTALLQAGDKVLAPANIYGGSTVLLRDILSKMGVEYLTADFKKLGKLKKILKKDKKIKVLYFETPTNPTLSCVDIEGVCRVAQKYGRKTVFDNTFCTPIIQRPFEYGVDFIIHSTTKYLNGHGISLAGVMIGKDIEFMNTKVFKQMIMLGTNCNPFDAWMINNGLKTLALRMERHSENALKVAQFLEKDTRVKKVNYPGLVNHTDHKLAKKQMRAFSGMLSFELKGGFEAAVQLINSFQLCTIAPTLGDVDTLVMHPASMSHLNIPKAIRDAHGITDGLIRLSIGIENVSDIITDLSR